MSEDGKTTRRRRGAAGRRSGRRRALRVLAAAGLGGVLVRTGLRLGEPVERGPVTAAGMRPPAPPEGARVLVTPTCVGCTGCVVVCPTAAIETVPAGIRVIQDLCVSCGYCQAGCAVDGIRVIREHRDG